jgi:molybdopterin molybdotransferase
MISVNEARSIIQKNVKPLSPRNVPLIDANGLVVAENIFAHTDIPAYAQSSMDGYAFKFSEKNNILSVSGEMAAGTSKPITIGERQAARIFTGAPLPFGADTVVMQENTMVNGGQLTIRDHQLTQGGNVRARGAEIKKGDMAVAANTRLTTGAIGFLGGIGIAEVSVFPPPDVTVILTGNELRAPGHALQFGEVYDANSLMLTVALQQAGIKNVHLLRATDDVQSVQTCLEKALQQSAMVLVTGGVSVGDYDFVVEATTRCNVERHFHKVRQKPGKPLFFGTQGEKLVFGLPGNPSSALTCFYIYVLPAIASMLQVKTDDRIISAQLNADYTKSTRFTQFLKASVANGRVRLLPAQESFRLHSFVQANCLAELTEEKENYCAGDTIRVYMLPV